jgi:hypothetical protein
MAVTWKRLAFVDDVEVAGSGVSAYNVGTQSIGAGYVAVTFDSEIFDIGGWHSTASNTHKFTVPTGAAGNYLLACGITFQPNATGQRACVCQVNGATIKGIGGHNSAPSGTYVCRIWMYACLTLAVGDEIIAYAYQNSGGNLNIGEAGTGGYENSMFISKVS